MTIPLLRTCTQYAEKGDFPLFPANSPLARGSVSVLKFSHSILPQSGSTTGRRYGIVNVLRRVSAVLVCTALLLGIAASASSSTSGIYFMAVNEKIHEMTPENMPMVVGGVLYVPYTLLSIRDTGINLGVSAQYSTTRRTVLVSNGHLAVTFNLQANNAYDPQGNVMAGVRAVVRNSMVFLPIAWICAHFGEISYTASRTPYGTLVRVTNDAAILNDAAFIDAANGILRDNLISYQQAVSQQEDPSVEPSSEPTVQPDSGPIVYLGFLPGTAAEPIAQQLESLNQRAVFFFSVQQLPESDDLVRRLVGAGHTVALDLSGSTVSDCVQQAREGSRLLSDIARCPVYIVRANNLTEDARAQLAQEGWAVWAPTLWAGDVSSASQLLAQLSYSQPNYVEAACETQYQSMLTSALRSLAGSEYRLYQAVPSAL